MMRSLYSGVSGLKGHQTKMDVIGNNIANVNTTGFKSGRVTFADTLSQTQASASAPGNNIGGTNPKQIGLGVGVASIDTLFTDGSIQSTGKNTDVAISGNALFIMKKGGETYYTRDGAFEFDGDGNYVLPGSGLYVQGWMSTDGVIDKSKYGNIQIGDDVKTMEAAMSTTAVYSGNLNAAEPAVSTIKLNDSLGNTITLDPSNTTTYSINDVYTSTITKETVKFTNGLELTSASGAYSMGGTYLFNGNLTVTLANGDTMSVPNTSTATYKVSNTIPSPTNSIQSYTPTTGATFADGAILTNNSGTTYTITLINGDTISVPSTSSGTYSVNNSINNTENVTIVTGNQVTLQSGSTLTNNSGGTYTAHLVSGDTFTIPSTGTYGTTAATNNPFATATVTSVTGNAITLSTGHTINNGSGSTYTSILANTGDTLTISPNSTTTYTNNAQIPQSLLVTSINNNTVTLSDGSTIQSNAANIGNYTLNSAVNDTLGAINGFTASTIQNITGLPTSTVSTIAPTTTSTISQIDGNIVSGDGTTIDSFTTKSSSVSIKPSSGLTVSDITLTDDKNSTIKVKNMDTNLHQIGETYTSKVSSMNVTMSDGTSATKNSGSYTQGYSSPLSTTLTLYDTLGNAHSVVLYFTKTKIDSTEGNQWTVSINLDGSGSTTVTGEKDGRETKITMPDTVIQFDTNGKYVDGTGTLTLTMDNGATNSSGAQTVTIDLTQISQFTGGSTIKGKADGKAEGNLKSTSIDASGVIKGTYTNGESQAIAQIAFAQFNNASGLTKTGSSLYQASSNSGDNGKDPDPMEADVLGITITPSALEMSNIDIANEFSDMIITQRGFQSNSKIITVSDEMLETMINMKR